MSIIAISSEAFSGGEALAGGVAERLAYRCTNQEILLEKAGECGISLDDLPAAMEKPPSFWKRRIGLRTPHLGFVRAALCEVAREGGLVYQGHCGHLLLPGVSHVIRVRVIADLDFRVETAMGQQHLRRAEALACIKQKDRDWRQWARFLFKVDPDDPHLYDAVLNASRLSLAAACGTVAGLTEYDQFKPTAQSLQAIRDFALAGRVAAVLARHPVTREQVRPDVSVVLHSYPIS